MNAGKLRLRGHGRRITSRHLYDAALALLVFFVPVSGAILYWLLVDDFIPSDRLFTTSVIASCLMAVLMTIRFAPQALKDFRGQPTKMIFFLAFIPTFTFLMFHAFVTLACGYVLHAASNAEEVHTVARVTHVTRGSRACRHAAVFAGDRFLLHQRLCGLSIEAQRALAGGGRLEVMGSQSPFGLRVQAYRVLAD
jgi:small-conductance mechanosensitive channel